MIRKAFSVVLFFVTFLFLGVFTSSVAYAIDCWTIVSNGLCEPLGYASTCTGGCGSHWRDCEDDGGPREVTQQYTKWICTTSGGFRDDCEYTGDLYSCYDWKKCTIDLASPCTLPGGEYEYKCKKKNDTIYTQYTVPPVLSTVNCP